MVTKPKVSTHDYQSTDSTHLIVDINNLARDVLQSKSNESNFDGNSVLRAIKDEDCCACLVMCRDFMVPEYYHHQRPMANLKLYSYV